MARITLEHLRHSYLPDPAGDADWALKQIDLEWEDGGAYALLGPSGCGKTTLLSIISGLIRPTRGRVLFDAVDVTALDPVDRHVAQVFQFPVIYDTMTVHGNLAFPLRNRAMAPDAVDARVREVAAMLDLDDKLGLRASGLTADDKQKISLGRGLVRSDVNAIMFDEPLTVIDPHLKWVLRSKALPLLIPWNVVGAMWNIFALPEIGLLGHTVNAMGIAYNFTQDPASAWITTVVMDVWHWTSLVVLLAYAGLCSIPDAYYQAAKIDGASAWAVFRYIELPKMKRVLTIAILLRFMDSFMIYTEPFVLTGGGPATRRRSCRSTW